jgi:hypothetical protein
MIHVKAPVVLYSCRDAVIRDTSVLRLRAVVNGCPQTDVCVQFARTVAGPTDADAQLAAAYARLRAHPHMAVVHPSAGGAPGRQVTRFYMKDDAHYTCRSEAYEGSIYRDILREYARNRLCGEERFADVASDLAYFTTHSTLLILAGRPSGPRVGGKRPRSEDGCVVLASITVRERPVVVRRRTPARAIPTLLGHLQHENVTEALRRSRTMLLESAAPC